MSLSPARQPATTADALAELLRERIAQPLIRFHERTNHLPGTPEKIDIMELRERFKLPMEHPDDAQLPEGWYWEPVHARFPKSNGRVLARILYDSRGNVRDTIYVEEDGSLCREQES